MDKHEDGNGRLVTILICIFGVFLGGFLAETFDLATTFLVLLAWGGLGLVYHFFVTPIIARFLPHQKFGETPKSFLKKCSMCGREIPIASEECHFCNAVLVEAEN